MINITQQCESLVTMPLPPVSGNADTSKDVLPDRRQTPSTQAGVVPANNPNATGLKYAYRSVQNTSGSVINVAFGRQATALDFNIQLPQYASWSVYTLENVSVYGANAWSVAVTEIVRPVV